MHVFSWVSDKFCVDSVFLHTLQLNLSQQFFSKWNKLADILPRGPLVAYRDTAIVSAVRAQALAVGAVGRPLWGEVGAAPCQTQPIPARTHHRAQLSPSAKWVVPLGKCI